MKFLWNEKKMPLAVGAMGLVGMALRLLIALVATDSRGLTVSGHPLTVILWGLTAVVAAAVSVFVWNRAGSRNYGANFPASSGAAIGCGIMALCVMASSALNLERSTLGYVHYGLGLVSGSCLIFLTYGRYRGIATSFLFHCFVCVFLAVHLVSRYRPWSGDPQMLDYIFEVFACVLLMLYAYQQAAFQVGMGKRRTLLWLGLAAGYCSFVAVATAPMPLLYLGGGIWALTNLCSLELPRRRKAAPEAPRPEEDETA